MTEFITAQLWFPQQQLPIFETKVLEPSVRWNKT